MFIANKQTEIIPKESEDRGEKYICTDYFWKKLNLSGYCYNFIRLQQEPSHIITKYCLLILNF